MAEKHCSIVQLCSLPSLFRYATAELLAEHSSLRAIAILANSVRHSMVSACLQEFCKGAAANLAVQNLFPASPLSLQNLQNHPRFCHCGTKPRISAEAELSLWAGVAWGKQRSLCRRCWGGRVFRWTGWEWQFPELLPQGVRAPVSKLRLCVRGWGALLLLGCWKRCGLSHMTGHDCAGSSNAALGSQESTGAWTTTSAPTTFHVVRELALSFWAGAFHFRLYLGLFVVLPPASDTQSRNHEPRGLRPGL